MSIDKVLRLLLIIVLLTFILGNILHPVKANAIESNQASGTLLITTDFDEALLEKAAEVITVLPDNSNLTIVIDSGGGKVYVEDFIFGYIKLKHLSTTAIVPAFAASAAAMTAIKCDSIRTPDDSIFIFHMSFILGPNGEKVRSPELIKANIDKDGPLLKKIMTAEQYQAWLNGKDVTLLGKQIKEKLNNVSH